MTDNLLILLIVIFLIFAAFCVPFLVQILRTASEMAKTLRLLNERLPQIMRNVEEITTNVNRTSTTVHRQVAEISLAISRVQRILSLFFGMEELIRSRMSFPFERACRTSVAVGKGVRAFIDSLAGADHVGKA